MNAKSSKITAPDFAYPQQVIKDADAMLNKALKAGDGIAVVDALIRGGLAQTAISPDSLPAVISHIEVVAAKEQDEVTHALLDLLLAEIYAQYYQSESYNFDHRPALAEPGTDITLWSGKEFKDKVISLYRHALTHAEALKKAHIADYSRIITCDKTDAIFYPTLYDFASLQAVKGISSLSDVSVEVLSPIYLYDIRMRLPNVLAKPSQEAIEIANRWVEANHGAARIAALLQRYKMLKSYVVDGDDNAIENPLIRLYEENKETIYAIEFLLSETPSGAADKTAIYKILNDFAEANPTYFRINAVKNLIAELSKPTIKLTFPTCVARGKEFVVDVRMDNINATDVKVYRVKDVKYGYTGNYSLKDCYTQPVATIPVECEGSIPFSGSSKIGVSLPEYGIYVLTTSLKNSEGNSWLTPIYCSDIALLDTDGKDLLRVYAVDGMSGAPQSDVTIISYNNNGAEPEKLRSHTPSANGAVELNKGNLRNIFIHATRGGDTYCPGLNEYIYSRSAQGVKTTAFIRTSLAIYHPGDSLDFVAVVYDYQGDSRTLVKNEKLTATLRDVNNVVVGTLDICTDSYGRATGTFAIPEDCLTGYFTISLAKEATSLRLNSQSIAYQRVMVSDYKLPTYEAKVDSVAINESDGKVTIVGKALTYSGFPIQNAVVEASLSGLQRLWWRSNSVKYHIDTICTDAEGVFRWELSKEVLDGTPYAGCRYEAQFTVTSASGENRYCARTFAVNKENSITITKSDWYPAVKEARLNIGVNDPIGDSIDATLQLTFATDTGEPVEVVGKSCNGVVVADLSGLHSGTYMLTVKSLDVDAKSATASVVVYNANDKNCPVDRDIWSPNSHVTANATTRKAELSFGVPVELPHVLMTIYDKEQLLEQQWIEARKGMNKITVSVPDTLTQMSVRLSMVHEYEEWGEIYDVKVENPEAAIKVKIERMRNMLTPLAEETVTVKVSNGGGKGVGAAVILDMYSKAMDNLATQSWIFTPSTDYQRTIDFANSLRGEGYNDFYKLYKNLSVTALGYPHFDFYGMSWEGYTICDIIAYGRVEAAPTSSRKMNMSFKMESEDMMSDMAEEVEEVEEEAADAGNGATEEQQADNQYRPSEVPLAFFAPMLATDAEGNLTYSFTVPNANTTWVLNALAYNDMLATGLDIREAIASKPVMVEPNMPRFLRTGDEAEIRALVMNATEAEASVTTTFEILDPATGSVVDTQSVDTVVPARQSVMEKFAVTAPATSGTLMVRVKSSTEGYSDGVMTMLPILSSSQPVVDSSTFYLAPEQKELVKALPEASADAKVTLSFCENPTWEVVSALPGLRTEDATTSLSASAQIFAAAVSDYVLKLNPGIEPALKEWLATANEGNMLSMLNRNDDLKQLVLAATPWVEDAESDEQRIARLAILFDSKEIDRTINAAVKKLKKMQRGNGGWSWTERYDEASEWVTLLILNNFAELRQLGCCPEKLDGMVKKALEYVDAEVAKRYERYPKAVFSYYAYIRSLYPEYPMSTGAQKAYNATVQNTIKNWKKSTTAGKAADALLLYRSGYQNVANQILNSIREYATSTPELGMWWNSLSSWQSHGTIGQTAFILQAFNAIAPGCAEIDSIRQWLILNKIVQDWGTSVDASACVAAILQCGSSWLNRPGDVVITIEGKTIEPQRLDKLTGKVLTTVTDAGGELKIVRTADGPAWGAVVTQSTQVMKDVKAHSIPELSISKEHFVRTDGGWAPTDTFAVGQVVKVRLVIKSMREMDYVTLVDNRAATFEPVVQTPRPVYCDGIVFYLENRDAATNLFIDHLTKGQYVIEYEMNVNNAGTYSSGIATIQSQYTPEMTAHSAGNALIVNE